MFKSTGMPIKSIITGQTIPIGDFEEGWQNFIFSRQETLEGKLDSGGSSSEYLVENSKLCEVLEKVENKKLADEIREAISYRQINIIYMHYNKGFLDGIKLAMMVEQL